MDCLPSPGGLITMCRQNFPSMAHPAGAWVDSNSAEEKPDAAHDTDLSYWSELGLCYDPEWFPLGANLCTGK